MSTYTSLTWCLDSVFNVKALVGTFDQEEALVGAFSVIVKTDRSFAALFWRHTDEVNVPCGVRLLSQECELFGNNYHTLETLGTTALSVLHCLYCAVLRTYNLLLDTDPARCVGCRRPSARGPPGTWCALSRSGSARPAAPPPWSAGTCGSNRQH